MMLPETLLQDLRYAVRMLLRNPGFTFVSVFALALGIGVNTGAFTAYKAMVARPLDARDPGRMVNMALILQSGATQAWFSYPDYEAYRNRVHSMSGLITWIADHLTLTDTGGVLGQRTAAPDSLLGKLGLMPHEASKTELVMTFLVSENYFSVLGVAPIRGRNFPDAHELASSPSVLISENYWQKRFSGDPAILGKTIRLNGAAVTIIGIAPHDFVGTTVNAPDFWLPVGLEPLVHPDNNWLQNRENPNLRVFGRLAPGVTISQAQAEMTLLTSQIRTLHDPHSELSKPATALLWPGSPFPMRRNGGLELTILLVMIAVGMVLVIACANVASLQLARATSRQKELGMRLSLGASRLRLIRQLLTESALLGLLAGAVALPFTWALLRVMATKAADAFPAEDGTLIFNVNPDLEIFAYVLGISAVAGILFGLAPAIESSRSALSSAVRGNAGTSPVRSRRLRDFLIAAHVAISLVLMIAGSMFVRGSLRALSMSTGYDGTHVIDLNFSFPEGGKYSAARKTAIARELRTRLTALPGVAAITSARAPDEHGVGTTPVSLNGEKPSPQNAQAILYYTWVQPNYFQTLGIPLELGHGFRSSSAERERSVILSESAARRLWPGRNPIGRTLRVGAGEDSSSAWQVVGVARDTRGFELDGSDSEQVYLPLPDGPLTDYPILIRTRSNPATVLHAIEPLLAYVDPDLLASTATLDDMLHQTPAFLIDSLSAGVACTVGLFGLLLAAMGIYGTVSYIAVLRTREVGIRMTIGAQKRDILGLMMRESTRPVFAGLVVGVFLAAGVSRVLHGILYGLSTVDGVSFAGASLLFMTIALVATWPPSRRAMRVDPMVALRYE
jgi:macrolide transport system ATP-binding/permease protein